MSKNTDNKKIDLFYKLVDTKIMTHQEKAIVLEEMQWFFKQRKKVKIDPCQKTLNIIFEKIDSSNFKEAVDMCNIVAEMRKVPIVYLRHENP